MAEELGTFEEITATEQPAEELGSFEDIVSSTTESLFSRGYLSSIDQEIKDANTDFELAMETQIPTNELQAFGRYTPIPKKKRPMLTSANHVASRFSDQLWNGTISSVVRNLTDPDSSAAQHTAHKMIMEWEKEKGIKLSDELYEDQLADWTRQLYEEPKARESDFLKKLPKFDFPEQFQSYFDPRKVDQAEGWIETTVDAAAGIIGFAAQLAILKKAVPAMPAPMAWESVSIANGGKPGSGVAMYGAMGMVGKLFPVGHPITAKLGGGVGVGAIFGGTTYLAGGDTKQIIVNTGLPILLGAMSITSSEWNSLRPKSKLELIKSIQETAPQLKDVSTLEIDSAIKKSLVEAEVAGIRKLGKKPVAKATVGLKPVESTGKTVVSQHAARVEERAILEGTIGKDGLGKLATHEVANKQKQAEKANAIPPDKALQMVLTGKGIPSDTLHSMVYVAVKNRASATNDIVTLQALASSNAFTQATTRHAQELGALANEMQYDPASVGRNVVEARGVIPDKKLSRNLLKANKDLNKIQKKLSKKTVDNSIKEVTKIAKSVDIKAKTYGVKNRLVTKAMAEAAMKRLRSIKLFSGVDPANLRDVIEISTYHLEAIGKSLPAWSKAMVNQFGEKIKPHLAVLWKKANENLTVGSRDAVLKKLQGKFEAKSAILENTGMIRQLQDSLIRSGFKTRKPLLAEMHRLLQTIDTSITERQTMDAMSGSGKFKLLDTDEIKTIRRDINNQYQQVAKLQNMAKGKAPPATGFERQEPSAEGRKLLQQVNEAKKKGGFESVSPERELKSALASIKTRLRNRIEDLANQIKSGKRTIKSKKPQPSDAETVKLTKEKDLLQKEFDDMFGVKQISPEKRVQMATNAIKKSITELERKIKTGELVSPKKTSKTPVTQELEALRSRRTALKEELQLMRDTANPKATPEEIALQSYKTRLANERAKYDEMIATENFDKPTRKERKIDAETNKLIVERDSAKRVVCIAQEVMKQKGGIATDEMQRLNDLSNEVKNKEFMLGADPKNKSLQRNYGNALIDFEEFTQTLIPRPNSWRNIAIDVAGTPRTIMTSLDMSFAFRQGWGSMGTKEFWQAFGKQFQYAWSEPALRNLMAEIKGSPRYAMAKKAGLRMTDLGSSLELREEGMQSTMADRIPIVGRYVRGSQRAYTGMANYIRWHRFNNMADAAVLQGRSLKGIEGQKLTRNIANVINIFTGSGNLGLPRRNAKGEITKYDPLGTSSPELNQLFFSIRKLSADINMPIKAVDYIHLDPFARKMAQRQLIGSIAMTSSILTLASMSGLDVELNPTSGNFGMVVIGNKHVDITGGKASLVRFISRSVSGKIKDTERGEIDELTPYMRERLAIRFARGKLAPMASLVADVWLHQNYKGESVETPVEISNAVASRFYPMAISDIISLYEDDVDGDITTSLILNTPLSIITLLGAGTNVYEDKESGIVGY